jgi:hypothetical protein
MSQESFMTGSQIITTTHVECDAHTGDETRFNA